MGVEELPRSRPAWLGFSAADRSHEPISKLLGDANIYLRTAIKSYLRTAVEDDPSLAQYAVQFGSELKKQQKATKRQRKKRRR